ncbi:MAG: ATP-binding protein [Victivallales bacterium]|nr:ATP-binding protein [Victivallales bacterium]
MMEDISLHLLDVLENSAKAGAKTVCVDFTWARDDALQVRIADDGPGLPPEIAEDPTDPYRTTRTERPVGLGLSLLRRSAEESGGALRVQSEPGRGVTVTAEFHFGTVDARPLGDLPGVLAMSAVSWPGIDLRVSTRTTHEILDMTTVKSELAGIDPSHPAVRAFVEELLQGGLAELVTWAGQEFSMGD